MYIPISIKLLPNAGQRKILDEMMSQYIAAVNETVSRKVNSKSAVKETGKELPNIIQTQIEREAESIIHLYHKKKRLALLKNKKLKIGTDQYDISVEDRRIAIPISAKYGRETESIKFAYNPLLEENKGCKLYAITITKKKEVFYACASYSRQVTYKADNHIGMGIDLGLKCPAVCYTSTGKVRFFGSGRQIREIQAYYESKQRGAKTKEISSEIIQRKQKHLKNIDHQISKAVVDFALSENVTTIYMERLQKGAPIVQIAWSYSRLMQFIAYKAELQGIRIQYINPAYTSKKCPRCGEINQPNDRHYICSACGFKTHRDIVGAINICVRK